MKKLAFLVATLAASSVGGDEKLSGYTYPQPQPGGGTYRILYNVDVRNISSDSDPNTMTVHKFGANDDVGLSWEHVWQIGTAYPWPTTAYTVQIEAGGNAADDKDSGAGAREVTVQGLDENWELASDTLLPDGANASAASTVTFIRVFRAYVSAAGTYTGSNTGDITIEHSTGGANLAIIKAGTGQTEMTQYTVPAGWTGYLARATISVDGTQEGDVRMYRREGADIASAPFQSARLVEQWLGIAGGRDTQYEAYPVFPEKTDVWMEVIAGAGTTQVAASYDLVLYKN